MTGKNSHSFAPLLPEFCTGLSAHSLVSAAVKLLPGDNDCAFTGLQTHAKFAGEAAKRGQYQALRMLPKTGQSDALARGLHSQRRMQMPGQLKAINVGNVRLMTALKRAQRIRCRHHVKAPRLRRIAGMLVMIAAHEHHGGIAMTRPEASEIAIQRFGVAALRVHQIAKDNEAGYRVRRKQGRDALQIMTGMSAWQRHTLRPEAGRLAQMHICNKQRAPRRPEQRVLGQAQ